MKCMEEIEVIKLQQEKLEREIEILKGKTEVLELKEKSERVEKKLDESMVSVERLNRSIEERSEAMKVELKKDVKEVKVTHASFFKGKREKVNGLSNNVAETEDARKIKMRGNEGI